LNDTIEYFQRNNINFKRNFDLTKLSSIKAGGIANIIFFPTETKELIKICKLYQKHNIKYLIVGNMSNILLRDGNIETPIICTNKLNKYTIEKPNAIEADCGASLSRMASFITKFGYNGFSGLTGFPATLGGAIFMNASCYGNCISDYLSSVTCMDENGNIFDLNKDEIYFSWRHSSFHERQKDFVILKGKFILEKSEVPEDLINHMNYTKQDRLFYQEHKFPNLGSIFATKNIYNDIGSKSVIYKLLKKTIGVLSATIFKYNRHEFWAIWMVRMSKCMFLFFDRGKVGISKKTLNCVINKNKASANSIIMYIRNMKKVLNPNVPLEIEIFDNID